MLTAHLAGQPYVKSRHSAALKGPNWQDASLRRAQAPEHLGCAGDTRHAVDSRLPAKKNYQKAIFGAIDRYLTKHPDVLVAVPASTPIALPPDSVFVDPRAGEIQQRQRVSGLLNCYYGAVA
jgi:hypothetical protein